MTDPQAGAATSEATLPARVEELIAAMSLAEKAGQLTQYFSPGSLDAAVVADPHGSSEVEEALGRGGAGSLLFVTDPAETNRLQRLAIEGGRHGIPVLFGFDVIHGLRTILAGADRRGGVLGPRDGRARPGDGGPRSPGGGHPLDLRADGRHRPRPPVGTHRRAGRRGPVPRVSDGRGAGTRLPRRPGRDTRAHHRRAQALRRLRRCPRRPAWRRARPEP